MTTSNENTNKQCVGFAGLGDMGAPMAANLISRCGDHSLQLAVFDINLREGSVPASAGVAESLSSLAAESEVVFLSVPDGPSSLAVVQGLLESPDSRVRCVVNLSTVGIPATQQILELIAQSDSSDTFEYIDAPVSGGKAGAVNATITVMWSGSRVWFDQCQPLLSAFAKSLFFVGENPGQGQAVKLLNNYLSGVALSATSEAVRFGLHHGLDMKTMLDVVHVSTGQNMAVSDKFPKRILTGSYDAGFRMALMQKDISLYQESVMAAGLPANILGEVAQYWQQGVEQFPDGDFTEIFKVIDADD